MSTTTTTSIVVLFLLLSATTTISAAPILGLDYFLTHQSRNDPQATNDSYLSLPSSLRKSLHSHLPQPHLPSIVSSLLSLSLPVSLHIRLVGSFPSDSGSLLSSFLSSASQPLHHFHVISPFATQSHTLPIKHSLHLDVSFSPT
jgi:hypothetical protein